MPLLLPRSASWEQAQGQRVEFDPPFANPRTATLCDSVAKISKCDSGAADALRVGFFRSLTSREVGWLGRNSLTPYAIHKNAKLLLSFGSNFFSLIECQPNE